MYWNKSFYNNYFGWIFKLLLLLLLPSAALSICMRISQLPRSELRVKVTKQFENCHFVGCLVIVS